MQKRITDVSLDGFTAHSVTEGETVDIINRAFATSDSAMFYVFAEQIANLIFPKLEVSTDEIDRYLMVLHPDDVADVYLQDLQPQARVRVSRALAAGDLVRRNDLSTIEDVQFPNIPIVEGDRLVYFERRGWRFGIAFDLTRKTDAKGFGTLCAQLHTKLVLEDILQITLGELHKAEETGFDAFIITEGKTDWRHLHRGLTEVGYKRKLRYDTSDQDRGDAKLLSICESLALAPQESPIVCVFDRDNESLLRRLANREVEGEGYQNWGNNVYSFALPIPEHRKEYANLSIEMYYPDEVLARMTADGRRLCFDNEVKKEIVQGSLTRAVLMPAPLGGEHTKKLIASDIDTIENEQGQKVGLSKARFAEMVFTATHPFVNIDFSSFTLIARQLEVVLAAAKKLGWRE